jgi:hypothetical protein
MMVYMIQHALNDIVAWGHESGLEFNASKTMVSWYTNKKLKMDTLPRVKIGGISIDPVNEVKYLGMTLDNKLNFNTHIKQKINKCKGLLFAIKSCINKQIG